MWGQKPDKAVTSEKALSDRGEILAPCGPAVAESALLSGSVVSCFNALE